MAVRPGGSVDVDALQLLVAVVAAGVDRELGEGTALGVAVVWCRSSGPNGRSPSVFAQGPPPGALVRVKPSLGDAAALPDHGVICELVLFGPQVGGLVNGACGPPSKLKADRAERNLGVLGEGRGQLAGLGIGADVADQADEIP